MTTALRAEQLDARPEDVGISSTRLEGVGRLVARYIEQGRLPGAIVAVVRRGKTVHFSRHGKMDDEGSRTMTSDAIFRLASMTKPIASVALMTLYEEARFGLDSPVSEFIPEFRELKVFAGGSADSFEVRAPSRPMTMRDLLTHTSGIAQPGGTTEIGQIFERAGIQPPPSSTGTLAGMIQKRGQVPLACDPGAAFNYGPSTDVVGYVCEVISGQSFDRFLADRIFEPLGMTDTGFFVNEADQQRLAAAYRISPEGPPYYRRDAVADARGREPNSYISGAAGLVGTALDYIRFCKMLVRGGALDGERVLGSRTLRFMGMNHLPNAADVVDLQTVPAENIVPGVGWGLGWAVLRDPVRAGVIGSVGEFFWGGSLGTAFFISPADELAMVFMTQASPGPALPIRRELRQAVYQALDD